MRSHASLRRNAPPGHVLRSTLTDTHSLPGGVLYNRLNHWSMRNSLNALRFVPALALVIQTGAAHAQVRPQRVDFSYAPAAYLTAICLPADWQKTVITERGSLAYDFGPGPYTRPLTEISVGAKETVLTPEGASISDPRIPIATVRLTGEGTSAFLEEFAAPGKGLAPHSSSFLEGRVRRPGGLSGAAGWASPPLSCDPAFRNAAWGTNRPILYSVRVPAGGARRIALGFCEPYKGTPGQRVMDIRVEGAAPMTIDALKDGEKNRPYVYFFDARDENRDGEIAIEVHASQKGVDPNVILNAFWVFPAGTRITEEDVIRGKGTPRAEISWTCGLENERGATSSRIDGIIAHFEGKRITPVVAVRTGRTLSFDGATGELGEPGRPFVVARPRFKSARKEGTTWMLELPEGTTEAQVFVISGMNGGEAPAQLPDLRDARKNAERFWRTEAGLPFGRIAVPDSGIQYVLDASIRNLYQIAEWVDGGFQFQPGPSVYRGLWMHDAAWDVSTALALGDTGSARMSIETALRYQQSDGRIFQSEPYPMLRETPLILFALCRYARVSGNIPWLKSRFPAVSAAVGWIRRTRALTLGDPGSPAYGLFPPGFTDGGIGGLTAEYGTTFWALNALQAAARAASSLGFADSAGSWSTLAEELMGSFRKASSRDVRRDNLGNLYLPMKVGDTSSAALPQQANWGILDGQGFGHLFPYADTVLNGTLAMLDARTAEGIHQDVGWVRDGVWPFFSALAGITHVYQRNYARAGEILYAVANHASPLGTWLEEQLPKNLGTRTGGDASDATASSLFILLLRDMIVNERGDTVEVMGGIPRTWYRPGAVLRLEGAPTDFGPLSLDMRLSPDGESGSLSVGNIPGGRRCTLRVVLEGLKDAGFTNADGSDIPPARDLPSNEKLDIAITRRHR